VARDRTPNNDQFAELRRLANLAIVGATHYEAAPDFPVVFDEMGIKQRPPPTHTYLGWTVTRPDDASAVFGFSYKDANDSADANEDFFHVDLVTPRVRPLPGKKWENEDPRWQATHHGPKDYFT
jgi:hypothetical protein